jgi:hypothetical protein
MCWLVVLVKTRWLTGGAGVDYFDFKSVLNGTTNVDTITDFNRADDFIRLDNAVMVGLGATTGALTSAAFVSGAGRTAAADTSDRIIYNTTTGDLYYDADGKGSTAAIKIALIGTSPSRPVLDHTDFLIIWLRQSSLENFFHQSKAASPVPFGTLLAAEKWLVAEFSCLLCIWAQ